VACLRRAGHAVGLLAPRGPGAALVGPGPGEALELLPSDGADAAALFTGGGAPPPLQARLTAFNAAVAYTRSADLVQNLGRVVPCVEVQDPAPPPGSGHASLWLARPLSSLGVPCDNEDPPTLLATREERRDVAALRRDLPDRFLAVHPGSGSPSKRWPADRFAQTLDALDVDRFLLVEGPADAEAAGVLHTRGGAVAARGLAPRLLGALLAEAAAFVGNDSGVTHLAAAWGAPTVALFGPTDPAVWSPVGPRVIVVRGPAGGMDGIAVETVAAAVAPLLAEGKPGI
jgi:hypothetical protein